MSYTVINFKTKKALKEAIQDWKSNLDEFGLAIWEDKDKPIRCYNPGLGPDLSNYTGKVALEGPHYPKPHTWYAEGEMKDGVLVKVK